MFGEEEEKEEAALVRPGADGRLRYYRRSYSRPWRSPGRTTATPPAAAALGSQAQQHQQQQHQPLSRQGEDHRTAADPSHRQQPRARPCLGSSRVPSRTASTTRPAAAVGAINAEDAASCALYGMAAPPVLQVEPLSLVVVRRGNSPTAATTPRRDDDDDAAVAALVQRAKRFSRPGVSSPALPSPIGARPPSRSTWADSFSTTPPTLDSSATTVPLAASYSARARQHPLVRDVVVSKALSLNRSKVDRWFTPPRDRRRPGALDGGEPQESSSFLPGEDREPPAERSPPPRPTPRPTASSNTGEHVHGNDTWAAARHPSVGHRSTEVVKQEPAAVLPAPAALAQGQAPYARSRSLSPLPSVAGSVSALVPTLLGGTARPVRPCTADNPVDTSGFWDLVQQYHTVRTEHTLAMEVSREFTDSLAAREPATEDSHKFSGGPPATTTTTATTYAHRGPDFSRAAFRRKKAAMAATEGKAPIETTIGVPRRPTQL